MHGRTEDSFIFHFIGGRPDRHLWLCGRTTKAEPERCCGRTEDIPAGRACLLTARAATTASATLTTLATTGAAAAAMAAAQVVSMPLLPLP